MIPTLVVLGRHRIYRIVAAALAAASTAAAAASTQLRRAGDHVTAAANRL